MRGYTNWEGLWCKCSKLLQYCPTLCDTVDCSPPAPLSMGFSRQEYWSGLPWTIGFSRTRILEWVAISFSRGSFSPRDQTWVSCIAGRVLVIFWATRDYSTEVQNGEGMKMKGLQEGRVGKMQSTPTFTTPLCYTSSLPSFLPSLSSFILLWESFLSSVEVLAFVAGSFLRGKFL